MEWKIDSNNKDTVLRGVYVDMRIHDRIDDTWMLCRAGTRAPLVIGTRGQIMAEYDRTEASGIIREYEH